MEEIDHNWSGLSGFLLRFPLGSKKQLCQRHKAVSKFCTTATKAEELLDDGMSEFGFSTRSSYFYFLVVLHCYLCYLMLFNIWLTLPALYGRSQNPSVEQWSKFSMFFRWSMTEVSNSEAALFTSQIRAKLWLSNQRCQGNTDARGYWLHSQTPLLNIRICPWGINVQSELLQVITASLERLGSNDRQKLTTKRILQEYHNIINNIIIEYLP